MGRGVLVNFAPKLGSPVEMRLPAAAVAAKKDPFPVPRAGTEMEPQEFVVASFSQEAERAMEPGWSGAGSEWVGSRGTSPP